MKVKYLNFAANTDATTFSMGKNPKNPGLSTDIISQFFFFLSSCYPSNDIDQKVRDHISGDI